MEYTAKRIKEVLQELHITPLKTNRVDTKQAASILTWRMKNEYMVDRDYSTTAVRRRADTGTLTVAEQINARFNLYDVRDVFVLPLMPQRAKGTQQRKKKQLEHSSCLT
jgi:hypothetical protein